MANGCLVVESRLWNGSFCVGLWAVWLNMLWNCADGQGSEILHWFVVQGGRCFILLMCSLAFLTDVKQKRKQLNRCVLSPVFSKVVLQLISSVILYSVRRGMHLLTFTTVLYTFTGNVLYPASYNFQHGWFSWCISCLLVYLISLTEL